MAIFNEAYLEEASGSSLSNKQLEAIIKAVSKTYATAIKSAIKCLQSFKNLKEAAFNIKGSYGFRYDRYNDEVSCYVEGFDNYPYNKGANGKEAVKLLNEFKTDLKKYLAEVNKQNPDSHFVIMDDEGFGIDSYADYMKRYIEKSDFVPSNSIGLYIILKKKDYMKFAVSDSELKEAEKKNFLRKYDEFAKFLKNPHRLTGNLFWSGTIVAICNIIGMSSNELNSIVSSNIKPMNAKKINAEWFENDPAWGKKVSAKLGDCVVLEASDGEELVYSVPNKKMYILSFEHTECEEFFNSDYPYIDRDFEEAIYDDKDLKAELKKMFKEYDSAKKYNLIKG